MTTVRSVLRKKKNKPGLCPISNRITKDRKSSFVCTGLYINENTGITEIERSKNRIPTALLLTITF